MTWIEEIWVQINNIIQAVGDSLNDLVEIIDGVQFDETNVIYQFLGMVHYIIDDVIYTMISVMLSLGVLLMLYRLIILVISIITNLIPGLKGKITIR